MPLNAIRQCPCHSGKDFNNCCGKFIVNEQTADSPESLMRSRYSAYLFKHEDYLLKTWHTTTRPDFLNLEDDNTLWKKLVIIESSDNEVHFVAFFSASNNASERLFSLYQESKFIKENNCWFYLSGKELKTTELSKNMLCPCRSGKKFKRCCEKQIKD